MANQIDVNRIKASEGSYDEKQTKVCDQLRSLLQSIVILAVQAQDEIGNTDVCCDMVDDLSHDIERVKALADALATNAFYA